MQLSKRAQLSKDFVDKINVLVKQLKFNNLLHDDHDLKVQPEDKKKVLNRATRTIRKLEEQIDELCSKNKGLRKRLKENTDDRQEMRYHLKELQEALDFAGGKHPIQEALRDIKKENKAYKK